MQCLNSQLGRDFMNSMDVRKAFHVDSVNLTEWETCYDLDYTGTIPDERPMYREMIDAGINILIYNGDADACVPWVGNEEWTRSMNYAVTDAWRPWMVSAADRSWTGGFVTSYGKNFHFLTIKHAGHVRQPAPHCSAQWLPAAAHKLVLHSVLTCSCCLLSHCRVLCSCAGPGVMLCCVVSDGSAIRARGCHHILLSFHLRPALLSRKSKAAPAALWYMMSMGAAGHVNVWL